MPLLEMDEQAWNRGYEDGKQGKPMLLCPYRAGTTEDWSWSSGYIEGKAARHGYSAARPRETGKPRDAAEPSAVPLRSTAPVSAAEHRGQGGAHCLNSNVTE